MGSSPAAPSFSSLPAPAPPRRRPHQSARPRPQIKLGAPGSAACPSQPRHCPKRPRHRPRPPPRPRCRAGGGRDGGSSGSSETSSFSVSVSPPTPRQFWKLCYHLLSQETNQQAVQTNKHPLPPPFPKSSYRERTGGSEREGKSK